MQTTIKEAARSTLFAPLNFASELAFDRFVRPKYFKHLEFAEPKGDPGWFGPDSAVWYVHENLPVMWMGLLASATIESLHPGTVWANLDHSRAIARDQDRKLLGGFDPHGVLVRFAHSQSFFIATAYGSTESAERVAKIVRGMHHGAKGQRPDGLVYDADEPEFFRWNYATVVWGLATAHERYHARPLKDIDRYYREFVLIGEKLGGSDLPATKAEVADCLRAELPKMALTEFVAHNLFPARAKNKAAELMGWAATDMLPEWAQALVRFQPPSSGVVRARRATLESALNGLHTATGPIKEFRQARARVAAGSAVRS